MIAVLPMLAVFRWFMRALSGWTGRSGLPGRHARQVSVAWARHLDRGNGRLAGQTDLSAAFVSLTAIDWA